MSLLSSHIQVHDGLLVALSELLLFAERDLTREEVHRYLQPPRLGDRVPGVVDLTIDAAEWLGLLHKDGDTVRASPELHVVESNQLELCLPRLIRRGLLVTPHSGADRDKESKGLDLARALAWFLAQDSWDPPLAFEQVQGAAESRQARQFPDGPEFVNKTKWPFLCRWATFLGLGAPDPLDSRRVVPDPTTAVREELDTAGRDEWSAKEFVDFLASRCPVLDGGDIRVGIAESLALSELRWEHDQTRLSPSLSMAIFRLEHEGSLATERRADTRETERRALTIPEAMLTIDVVRLTTRTIR